ncbi:MAG TPA: retropepsin-like aspartic protease, partial [Kofleriaceae bacterium]|nr:retropepsin-like aspartic protease [Kofleriaceae bacterium]
MRRLLIAVALGSGCAVGAPPGFSDGDLWTFPLVAPLEDDLLLVPVYVNDRAEPLLFMIDPDSRQSSIDSALQSELKPYSVQAPEEVTEADSPIPIFVAEIARIKVGDLEVRNLKMRVHNAGTFFSGGRLVRGILGRDVISDSLVFAADRDRGVAFLAIQGSLSPPPGAIEIGYRHYFHRQITKVKLNDRHTFDVHLDIGARTSMLLPRELAKANLPRLNVRALLVDEYGYKREESTGGLAAKVALGQARADGVLFLPFGDKRIDDEEVQGVIGHNVFARFHLTMNWDKKKLWLKPRSNDVIGTARERLRRWGNLFDRCKNPACVTVQLVREQAPAPAAPAAPPAAPAAPPAAPAPT